MKITSDVLGVPVPLCIGLLPLVIAGFYFNNFFVGFVLYLTSCLVLSRVLFKDYLRLKTTLGPRNFEKCGLIKGVDETFLDSLKEAINENKKIVFSCPDNALLKNALHRYVECHLGQC